MTELALTNISIIIPCYNNTNKVSAAILSLPQYRIVEPIIESSCYVRAFIDRDETTICKWIGSGQTLAMVSGDQGTRLTPAILRKWIACSEHAFVVADISTDCPTGFSTLSTLEAPGLPIDHIEQCHLIIDPQQGYLTTGGRLCRAARQIAGKLGFKYLSGRVAPNNPYGLALVKRQKAQELPPNTPWAAHGFRWFRVNVEVKQGKNIYHCQSDKLEVQSVY